MKSLTRTVYGTNLINCLLMNQPFKVWPYSTLNEKLGVNADVSLALPHNHYPQLKYFCIGNGGHKVELSNTIPKISPVQHHSTDAAPFSMIPFVLRELDNDIPPALRTKYALRRIEEFNGNSYIAYYLKRIDFSKSKIEANVLTIEDDGTKSTVPFVPNNTNINPVPQEITHTGTNVLEAKYAEVSNEITISFSPEECQEMRNVANIMYNDEDMSIISEIGLVSGVDKQVQITIPGAGTVAMSEVIAAQMVSVLSTFRSCSVDNLGWDIFIKIGNALPLWITTPNNP